MAKINETERRTQNRVIALFQDKATLGYEYYGDLRHQINSNIITDILTSWLVSSKGGGYSLNLAQKAVDVIVRTAGNMQQGLYKSNQEVYSLLKYGAKVRENPGDPEKTIYFIIP